MTSRQKRFYVWAVDIWRQTDHVTGSDFGQFSKLASAVACLLAPKKEAIGTGELGREPKLGSFDHFDFVLGTDLRDTDMLQIVSGPGDVGRWFAISGGVQTAAFRGNRIRVLAKETTKPEGAP